MTPKVMKPVFLLMLCCLSIVHFGVFNASVVAKYLLVFIPELRASMELLKGTPN